MRFVMISNYYPSEGDPIFVFSQQIAQAVANCHGVETIVISPKSITRKIHNNIKIGSFNYEEKLPGNKKSVRVFSYPYLSFSKTKSRFLKQIHSLSYTFALRKSIRKAKIDSSDLCYCMFWQMAKRFDEELHKLKIQSNIIVESSESELEDGEKYSNYIFRNLKGIVCVSTEKINECSYYNLLSKAHYTLIPNGYDNRLFRVQNRTQLRRKYGFEKEAFIISFVGSFIERKGVVELTNVLNRFNDVYSIFVGKGPIELTCKNIIFRGSLEHDLIPEYISCSDVFVFPTKHEGCANAIIEAIACGLPVISSKRDFNNEILDNSCAILINPDDEDELYNAIEKLKLDKDLRERMGKHAIKKASELTLEKRTKAILDFYNNIGE